MLSYIASNLSLSIDDCVKLESLLHSSLYPRFIHRRILLLVHRPRCLFVVNWSYQSVFRSRGCLISSLLIKENIPSNIVKSLQFHRSYLIKGLPHSISRAITSFQFRFLGYLISSLCIRRQCAFYYQKEMSHPRVL